MNRQGSVSIIVILIMIVILLFASAVNVMSYNNYTLAVANKNEIAATYMAEAGMEIIRSLLDTEINFLNVAVKDFVNQRKIKGQLTTVNDVEDFIYGKMWSWSQTVYIKYGGNWRFVKDYPGKYIIKYIRYEDTFNNGYGMSIPNALVFKSAGVYGESTVEYNGVIQLVVDEQTFQVNSRIKMWSKGN